MAAATIGMERLERMRLVRAERSLDAEPKSRDRRYFIDDPLIAFWHRFVRPNMSSVAQGFGPEIWRHQVMPRLDDYMGGAFEEICRGHARRHAQECLSAPAQEVGQIWGADYDIDVAGRLLDGAMLYGECKWRRGMVGEDVLTTLIERAGRTSYGRGVAARHFVLYARAGFRAGVHERAAEDRRIVLHTPDTIIGVPEVLHVVKRIAYSAARYNVVGSGPAALVLVSASGMTRACFRDVLFSRSTEMGSVGSSVIARRIVLIMSPRSPSAQWYITNPMRQSPTHDGPV